MGMALFPGAGHAGFTRLYFLAAVGFPLLPGVKICLDKLTRKLPCLSGGRPVTDHAAPGQAPTAF